MQMAHRPPTAFCPQAWQPIGSVHRPGRCWPPPPALVPVSAQEVRPEGAAAPAAYARRGCRRARRRRAGGPNFKRSFPKNPKIRGVWWKKRGVTGAYEGGPEGVEGVQNGIGVCEITISRAKDRLRYWQREIVIFAAAQAFPRFSPERWWRRFRRGERHPDALASAG